MRWDELSEARKRVVFEALDVMLELGSQISSEEIDLSADAQDTREAIEAAIEKLRGSH